MILTRSIYTLFNCKANILQPTVVDWIAGFKHVRNHMFAQMPYFIVLTGEDIDLSQVNPDDGQVSVFQPKRCLLECH